MAISKKNKRPITYQGEKFLWWVKAEVDGFGNMLSVSIASKDGAFLINHFAVVAKPGESYMTVIGNSFPGLKRKDGCHVRLKCPDFSTSFVDDAVTPKAVRAILEWCFFKSKDTSLL